MPDFTVSYDDTLVVLRPVTLAAKCWCAEYLAPDFARPSNTHTMGLQKYDDVRQGFEHAGLSVEAA